jgi:LPS O-antigen subunit length determinant protein (WzzB/FepE family)
MAKNSQINSDEINLIELMYTVWKGKWKIAAAVVISFIVMISYGSIQTQKNNFTATTEIKPISTFDINKYSTFNNNIMSANSSKSNNDGINLEANLVIDSKAYTDDDTVAGQISKITSLKLLNIYINILEDGLVFKDAIREFNLLEASQYNNDEEYNDAIIKLASSIKILLPTVKSKENLEASEASYHTIVFKYDDAEKWKSVLTLVNKLSNELAKEILISEFDDTLTFLKKEKKYQLEDIEVKINNLYIDYEREVSDHISYLKEQSEIAKKLGIAKNTIEVQTFGNLNSLLSNVKTDSPFYLRGYEAIDKEVELIELRNNKKPFMTELYKLEKKKRSIEQDQTIERIELILQSTLLADSSFLNSKTFSAASLNAITTKFEYKDNKKMLVLAMVIGLMVGTFYVIISNAFQSHRVIRKKD